MSKLSKLPAQSEPIPLNHLQPGESACVSHIALTNTLRRRLQDMGLMPGVPVECVSISPLGDPAAYLIKGAVIALRRADSCWVFVNTGAPERVPEGYPDPVFSAPLAGCEN